MQKSQRTRVSPLELLTARASQCDSKPRRRNEGSAAGAGSLNGLVPGRINLVRISLPKIIQQQDACTRSSSTNVQEVSIDESPASNLTGCVNGTLCNL